MDKLSEDPDRIRKDWRTFIEATHKNNLAVVEKFIRCGGDVNYPKVPQSAMHVAVFKGNKDILLALLNANGKVNIQDEDGDTPLHTAIGEKKGLEIVKILLSRGADLYTKNYADFSPMQYAANIGNREILSEMEKQAEFIKQLCSAAENGNSVKVTEILSENPNIVNCVSEDHVTAVHEAAANGKTESLEILYNFKADLNVISPETGNSALHFASSKGHVDIVKFLLGKDVLIFPNFFSQTPLHCATSCKKHEVVRVLVESKKSDLNSPNSGGITALGYACMEGSVDTVNFLLENGANPNAGKSPTIFMAISLGKFFPEIVKKLVEYKADVNKKNSVGLGVLQLLKNQGKEGDPLFQYLKDCGATS